MTSFAAIVPSFNSSAHIGDALASLFGQTRPFDEILIIDDGSTDDSVEVALRLIAGRSNARLIRNQRNIGVVATLNRGLRLIESDYVHMASTNDTYSLHLLERCERALEDHPAIALFCGNATFCYKETHRRREVFMHLPQMPHYISEKTFHSLIRKSPLTFFGGSIVMRRRSVLEARLLQDSLRWHCDWTLYYLLALRYGVYFIPEPLVNTEMSEESYSSQAMIWKQQREVIHALILLLAQDYPDMRQRWKSAALLPTYDIRALAFLRLPECRWFVTPLLLWRLLVHTVAYRLKGLLPRSLLIRLRPVFRV